ncbi:MAG TPA: hypothetical protein VGN13_13060 [Solirubrobacteraceae bacterium]|jgi:hypothetical protein
MAGHAAIELTLLPGARRLLALHAHELPQRDDLCGAFCGALALGAAGITADGEGAGPLDQDAVALAAGSVISPVRDPGTLPLGEAGRRDYRLAIPEIEESDLSGTTAGGVREAIEALSAGALAAIPLAGPWNDATLAGLFELAAELRSATLIANFATHHLWGSHASVGQLLGYLLDGEGKGPAPDWRVGHFACVFGRVQGPGGVLYAIADTYPSLGDRGVHVQPQERLAAALERADMPAGGMLAVVCTGDAAAVRVGAHELGLRAEIWDNGTIVQERPA